MLTTIRLGEEIWMKKEMLLAFAGFFLTSLSAITGVYAIEENQKVITISKEEADITGDNKNEVISLKGIPYENEKSYLKKVYIKVTASNDKTYTIPLESGSKAAIQLKDITHDGVKDIFTTIQTEGSGGTTINFLHSLKDFTLVDLPVPEPLEMESRFLNDYKAEIKVKETGKSYAFNLKDRKTYYKKLGLYYKGKLNEPMELTVNPFSSLTLVELDNSRVGLKGIQTVTGIANADTIAIVESIWRYDTDHWKLVDTHVANGGK